MRIVQIAPFEEPVPPAKYGGTELVVYNLVEEMTRLGHEVYLLAAGDSQTSAKLVPIVEKSLRQMYSPKEIGKWRDFLKFFKMGEILKIIHEINPDIVHNHLNWRLLVFSELIDCPMYTTIHGPITSLHERYTYEHFADSNYISISDNQRKAMPNINWVKTIYNGIDLKRFEVGDSDSREYFAFLGRISPEKGIKEICTLIKSTKHKLRIAAKIDAVDQAFYEQEVKPLIDGDQIQFVGEVGHTEKTEFLKHAKGLLLWLNWEEPFGLVVTEAMACGTPVIVNDRGSMSELIVDGVTGFLVQSLAEMQSKLDQVSTINSQDCRDHVERKFSSSIMAKQYLRLAGKLTNS